MFTSEKIYTAYEKPESAEPTERVVLLKEGFTFWALVFGPVWLLAKRQWLLLLYFVLVATALTIIGEALHLSEASATVIQLWLQLMLAYHASDLCAWRLKHRGYRFAGVLAAESPMHAQRRYFEFAQ